MDGSVDGDIAELSYSPIVVSVYFIWVRKMILIQIFSILYIILHLVYDIWGTDISGYCGVPVYSWSGSSRKSRQVEFNSFG